MPRKKTHRTNEIHVRLTDDNYLYLNQVIEENALGGITAGINFVLRRDKKRELGIKVGLGSCASSTQVQ